MTTDTTTAPPTDTDDDLISDETLVALRKLAVADGDAATVDLCNEALVPRMQLTEHAYRRRRREVRLRCADAWTAYAARTGLVLEPVPRITDEQIAQLRRVAEVEEDAALVDTCDRALRSTEARRAAERAWRTRRLTPAIGLAVAMALLAAACGQVEAPQLAGGAGGVVVEVDPPAVVVEAPPPPVVEPPPPPPPAPRPRLGFRIAGQVRSAITVAQCQVIRYAVVATDPDGYTRTVTEPVTLTSPDPSVASAGYAGQPPGVIESGAPGAAASTVITASLAGFEDAALAVQTLAYRYCRPKIDAIGPYSVRVANACTEGQGSTGWRLAYRGPAAVGPGQDVTLATLATNMAPYETRLVSAAGVGWSGGVALIDENGSVVDAVAYGAVAAGHPFAEGAPAPALAPGATLQRRDSWDTQDNAADIVLVVGGGGL
jgi:hypothetical protein